MAQSTRWRKPGRPPSLDGGKTVMENIRMEPELRAELISHCRAMDYSKAWVIRAALKDYLKRHKERFTEKP